MTPMPRPNISAFAMSLAVVPPRFAHRTLPTAPSSSPTMSTATTTPRIKRGHELDDSSGGQDGPDATYSNGAEAERKT